MSDFKLSIGYAGFPDQLAPDSEKQSWEYGLKVGQAIESEWFKKDSGGCRYYNQLAEFHRRRLYARGEQPIQKYKDEIAVEGDLSYMNLDWTPVSILPKFIDIVVNGMSDRLFKVSAYAQDAMSQTNRSRFQNTLEGQMAAKDILMNIKEQTGVDPFLMDPSDLPETDEELSLYMQLKYKPAIEVAEEEAINTMFAENKYDDIRKQFDYDQAVLGIAVGKHEFLPGEGVKISYVDPANVVYSYTDSPTFDDCFYWGEVKVVHKSELYKIKPDITKDEMEKISKVSQAWYNSYGQDAYDDGSIFANEMCALLYYNYKTTKRVVFKKKVLANGGYRVIEKDDTFDPPQEMLEEGNFEVIDKVIDVWYDGVMILGANMVIKWELMKNMVRPKSSSQHAIPNYVAVAPRMYKGNIESLCKRMIPFADQIQITHLKLQQITAKVVPDGVFIDADGINEVDLGEGGTYTPKDALRLYFQTGSVVGRSYTQEGEFNNARIPIQELNKNSGQNKASMLIANYNHYLNMIRDVTGLNEARDASTPDPNALVGLQKLAALNSNTATRHILDSSLFMYRSIAEGLTYRISDIIEYADFREDFINKIGKYNVSILDEIRDLYLYDFGIFIEVSPDEEQKAKLEENIQVAISKGNIDIEDAIDIREIRNIKLANQLLKLKRVRRLAREEKMKMQQQAILSQQQLQSQQMAAQITAQKVQMEVEGKIKVREAEAMYEIMKLEKEAELKGGLMAREFEYNMKLASVRESIITDRDKMKEDEKKKRIDRQSTQQSKMISQRQNGLPPLNFESNEDTLDGLGLEQYG